MEQTHTCAPGLSCLFAITHLAKGSDSPGTWHHQQKSKDLFILHPEIRTLKSCWALPKSKIPATMSGPGYTFSLREGYLGPCLTEAGLVGVSIFRRKRPGAAEEEGPRWWALWRIGGWMWLLATRTKWNTWQPSCWPNLKRMRPHSPLAWRDR